MIIANQEICSRLYALTKWEDLYWWNYDKLPDDKEFNWKIYNHKLEPVDIKPSVPAYTFDYMFGKMRGVFKLQSDEDLLQSFKMLLNIDNPANSLCRLAIGLAEKGLLK